MDKSTRVYYLEPGTGEKRYAVRNRRGNWKGYFTLSRQGNTEDNYVRTKFEDEMIALVRQNCSVRCENKDAPALLKRYLYIDGKPVYPA